MGYCDGNGWVSFNFGQREKERQGRAEICVATQRRKIRGGRTKGEEWSIDPLGCRRLAVEVAGEHLLTPWMHCDGNGWVIIRLMTGVSGLGKNCIQNLRTH
ncbi:unnamed protein product [Prunus brigantina]